MPLHLAPKCSTSLSTSSPGFASEKDSVIVEASSLILLIRSICDGSKRIPSVNPLGKSLGYQFALFITNPSEEGNRDI
ncbi:hypothetical protein TNCV_53041 [Trichonephila clavipes]|nr:hypothetical protein TNCV_53041 [Trichonephila clavipes]